MTNRSKIIAAALGLVIAAAGIADVSAQTSASTPVAAKPVAVQSGASKTVIGKTVPAKTASTKTVSTKTTTSKPVASKVATSKHRRLHIAKRGTKHLTMTHRFTSRGKIAHKFGLRHFAKVSTKGRTTVVR